MQASPDRGHGARVLTVVQPKVRGEQAKTIGARLRISNIYIEVFSAVLKVAPKRAISVKALETSLYRII